MSYASGVLLSNMIVQGVDIGKSNNSMCELGITTDYINLLRWPPVLLPKVRSRELRFVIIKE